MAEKIRKYAAFIKIAVTDKQAAEAVRDYYVSDEFRNAILACDRDAVFMYADKSPLSVPDKELIACCLDPKLVYDVDDVVKLGFHARRKSIQHRGGDIYDAGGNVTVAPQTSAAPNVSVIPQKTK